jgi:hypothetical protein
MRLAYSSFLLPVVLFGLFVQGTTPLPVEARDTKAKQSDAKPATPATGQLLGRTLPVKLLNLTCPVKQGAKATCTIKTDPNSSCTISVNLKSGPAKAAGLEPIKSNEQGVATWNWIVAKGTASGDWPVSIQCTSKDRKGEVKSILKVTQ